MKKFALIILTDLEIKRFDHKDEVKTAIGALQKRKIPFTALKFNAVAGCYAPMEVHEI